MRVGSGSGVVAGGTLNIAAGRCYSRRPVSYFCATQTGGADAAERTTGERGSERSKTRIKVAGRMKGRADMTAYLNIQLEAGTDSLVINKASLSPENRTIFLQWKAVFRLTRTHGPGTGSRS